MRKKKQGIKGISLLSNHTLQRESRLLTYQFSFLLQQVKIIE